jgi:hypothetical protein
MNPKITVALLAFAGTFVSALGVAKVVPSAMTTMSWVDTLYSVGLQGVVMALASLTVTTDTGRKLLRLR